VCCDFQQVQDDPHFLSKVMESGFIDMVCEQNSSCPNEISSVHAQKSQRSPICQSTILHRCAIVHMGKQPEKWLNGDWSVCHDSVPAHTTVSF